MCRSGRVLREPIFGNKVERITWPPVIGDPRQHSVGLTSLIIFNVAVNSLFMHWLYLTVDYMTVVHDVMAHLLGRILGVFYLDDGILVFGDPEWLQGALNIFI